MIVSAESPAQTGASEIQSTVVPWSVRDCWLGVGAVVFLLLAAVTAVVVARYSGALAPLLASRSKYLEAVAATALEIVYLVPVMVILPWRHAGWQTLGFRKFSSGNLGIGCGLLILTYMAVIIYNTFLMMLKIGTQGTSLLELLRASDWPVGYVIPTVIAAPFAEEIFFRGFLFQGLRPKLGWNVAALLSSSVFAVMHLQLAALIPTFLLGYLFSFAYHRSNSIWPGIILHFLVNAFGICASLAVLRFT